MLCLSLSPENIFQRQRYPFPPRCKAEMRRKKVTHMTIAPTHLKSNHTKSKSITRFHLLVCLEDEDVNRIVALSLVELTVSLCWFWLVYSHWGRRICELAVISGLNSRSKYWITDDEVSGRSCLITIGLSDLHWNSFQCHKPTFMTALLDYTFLELLPAIWLPL